MKTLEQQLNDYGDFQTERHGPISFDELTAPLQSSDDLPHSSRRRSRRSYAAAAAVIIALLIGGVAWLTAGGPQNDVINPTTVITDRIDPTTVTSALTESDTTIGESSDLRSVFSSPSAVLDLAATDEIIVAVGGTPGPACCGTGVDGRITSGAAVVWTSTDGGLFWSRSVEDEEIMGGAGIQLMTDVTSDGEGFFAAGWDEDGSGLWSSEDGLAWQRLEGPAEFENRDVRSLVAWDGRLFLFASKTGRQVTTFVWSLPLDGGEWSDGVSLGVTPLGGRLEVVATPAGLLAWPDSGEGLFTSEDAIEWQKVGDIAGLPLPLWDVAVTPNGYRALVGRETDCCEGPWQDRLLEISSRDTYFLWESDDGLTWSQDTERGPIMFRGRINAIGANGSQIIGAGYAGTESFASPLLESPTAVDVPSSVNGLITRHDWTVVVGFHPDFFTALRAQEIAEEVGAWDLVTDVVVLPNDPQVLYEVTGLLDTCLVDCRPTLVVLGMTNPESSGPSAQELELAQKIEAQYGEQSGQIERWEQLADGIAYGWGGF